MKLPDAVVDKLQAGESPVTHAAIIEGVEMIIRYTCDEKVIGQSMFHYTPETYLDWFRSMMNEMEPDKGGSTKKNKVKIRKRRPTPRASRSHRETHAPNHALRRTADRRERFTVCQAKPYMKIR
jgi:hypothetical protein